MRTAADERDPRKDPRPGDVLKFASSVFTVLEPKHPRHVTYDISGWNIATLPIDKWQEYTEKWDVLHVAQS